MTPATSKKVHATKVISIPNMLGFAGLLLTQIAMYGNYMAEQGARDEKILVLEKSATKYVDKTSLDQRLKIQEVKIIHVADDLKEVKQIQKENQQLIIELLQRIPKKDTQ